MTKLIVDGKAIDVPWEYTPPQACGGAGAEIPRFCFHERLSIAGNCRMWKCEERRIAENTSAYIRVDAIDALQPQLAGAAEGGRIGEVQSREWGMREFYVRDPSGNLLRFGQLENPHG